MDDRNALARKAPSAESYDSFEVPAAVLCALCGHADCEGCTAQDDDSGVVAIVPWERPVGGWWERLWATSRASTQGAEGFFAALPTGPLAPAMGFALVAESFAVCSMLMAVLPLLALALPDIAMQVALDPGARSATLRWLAIGLPLVTAWMIGMHAAHGYALDLGARRAGAVGQPKRALRFGFYACGWDLMTSPLGGLVTLLNFGVGDALELVVLAMRVPGDAAGAMLRGLYRLDGRSSQRARRFGGAAAMSLVVATLLLALGAALFA
jgi:hypothetical protein